MSPIADLIRLLRGPDKIRGIPSQRTPCVLGVQESPAQFTRPTTAVDP
jgi:hypothetical protein